MSTIIDDAVASGRPAVQRGDIMAAFADVDNELGDQIKATPEDLDGLHDRFKRRWDGGGYFRDHDHLLTAYAQAALDLGRKPCAAAA